MNVALTRSLASLRAGELTVLRAPAEPAPSAVVLPAGSQRRPPLAASASTVDMGGLWAC
jgi:hypothetical protein